MASFSFFFFFFFSALPESSYLVKGLFVKHVVLFEGERTKADVWLPRLVLH